VQRDPSNLSRHAVPPRQILRVLLGALALVACQYLLPADVGDGLRPGAASEARAQSLVDSSPAAGSMAKDTKTASLVGAGAPVLIPPVPPFPAPRLWLGVAGQDANLRGTPDRSGPPLGELKAGQPVQVKRWVAGEEVQTENPTWAELANGRFVYSAALRRAPVLAPPALPESAPTEGRWIDVNLFEQIATAYEGRTPIKIVLISTGRPGWDTPQGTFRILRRVENETMDGSTLAGQGPGGRGASYRVENVRFTQYFTADGAAIHENYWRNAATFGMPGSHGCIGMLPADAAWFWQFATVGTPLVVHG
jgi:hypothetical protein